MMNSYSLNACLVISFPPSLPPCLVAALAHSLPPPLPPLPPLSGADGLLKLWNVKGSECLNTFDAHEDKVR